MQGQIRIRHKPGPMLAGVKKALGHPHRLQTIHDFAAEGLSYPVDQIPYAVSTPGFRALCFTSTTEELQILVLSGSGSVRQACESIWEVISAIKDVEPELREVLILDTPTGTVVVKGLTGLAAIEKRREGAAIIMTGCLTVIWLAVAPFFFDGSQTSDIVIGAAPALLAGVAYVVFGIRGWRKILWEVP